MPQTDTIFITGFPGFIAARLVRRLADADTRFQILVQPAFMAQAEVDARRIADETAAPPDAFRLIPGDITEEGLGMSATDAEEVRREANVIFHLAAIYDLGVRRDLAMRVNVAGTQNVNRFAATLRRLRHYHYVSTCYVAGKRTGTIYENELAHTAGFRNHYEETKYLAEQEVERLKGELPITIHRPSVVCGDSHTGETAKFDGIYYLINYLRKRPALLALANIGNPAVRLNIVPVDFIVSSLVALARDMRAIGATLQLADPAPLTTVELFDHIARALTQRSSLVRLPPPLVRTTLEKIPFTDMVTGMPRVAAPYFFIEQEYDTARAAELLRAHGVACPPFDSYVENLIGYIEREAGNKPNHA